VTELTVRLLGSLTVIDRRKTPRIGYRAVHVVVEVDGYPVEIQIRTRLQQSWANGMERYADAMGRQVRYGGVPSAGSPQQLEPRKLIVAEYQRFAESIEQIEIGQNEHDQVVDAMLELLEAESREPDSVSDADVSQLADRAQTLNLAIGDALTLAEAQVARVQALTQEDVDSKL